MNNEMEKKEKTVDQERLQALYLQFRDKFKRGFLRWIVLKLFNLPDDEGDYPEYSGKDLIEELKLHTIDNWEPSPGSIYPILSELQDEGIIEFIRKEQKTKLYKITPLGINLLKKIESNSILFKSDIDVDQIEKEKIDQFKENFRKMNENVPLKKLKMQQRKFSIMAEVIADIIENRKD